jgi:DHA2 family multidrug resistance protein
VFLINLPIGLFAFIGLSAFMPEVHENPRDLDVFGYGMLAAGIASLQLMLDRGQMQDWFHSTEICIEATLAAAFLYTFVVHVLTAEHPFVRLAIFRDRNFLISTVLGFFVGVMIFSIMALLPPLLTDLMGHPVILVGLAMAPRGFGTLFASLFVGRIINRVDARLIVFVGLLVSCASAYQLSRMSLASDDWLVETSGVLNGIGTTLTFVPLAAMAFATLPRQYRNEGAAISTLVRYVGSAVGISMVEALTVRNAAIVQSRLTEGARPDNPILAWRMPGLDLTLPQGAAGIEQEIVRQAMMVSYVDTFWVLFLISAAVAPFVFLLRTPKGSPAQIEPAMEP